MTFNKSLRSQLMCDLSVLSIIFQEHRGVKLYLLGNRIIPIKRPTFRKSLTNSYDSFLWE
jgi:hypothetical protein